MRIILAFLLIASLAPAEPPTLSLQTRRRISSNAKEWQLVKQSVKLDARKTALVICDMWDTHTCPNAARRVGEMAPRVNEIAKALRARGVLIIHCPSDTMKFYEGTPQRRLAQSTPPVEPKVPLQRWCKLDPAKEAPLPIDDTDDVCDGETTWKKGDPYPWTRQHPAIEIAAGDAITDSAEAYYLMQQRGIDHIIVCGVHLNMCVLGRPFAIRQMVTQGKDVLLARDLTDTMYNPKRAPFVPHVRGTELMIEHVEKYWCASFTSADLLGGEAFQFSDARKEEVGVRRKDKGSSRILP